MPYTPSIPGLTLSQQPQSLAPVNAPLWFVSTSNSNQFTFFKYVYSLYSYDRFSTASTFLGQYKLPPRPNSDLGIFDSHKILQSQVGAYTFSYTVNGLEGVVDNNSVAKYRTFYGYEYDPNYRFDNTFESNSTTQLFWRGLVTFNYSTGYDIQNVDFPSNPFPIPANFGDFHYTINVSGATVPGNNGLKTVVSSDGGHFITVAELLSGEVDDVVDITINKISNIGYLGLDFNNYSPNLFQVGDIINVYMDNQNQNGSYNGLTEITLPIYSPATASLTLTSYGVSPSGPETGVVNSLQRVIGSSSYVYAFPGTRQYIQPNQDFGITNAISSAGSNFATNYGNTKQIYINQYETLSIMCLSASAITNSSYEVKTYDDGMTLLNTYTSTIPTGITPSFIKYELGTGTKNLQGWAMSGTPISLPITGFYTIALIGSTPYTVNAIYKYQIVNNCSRYPNVRIQFMNRVGGYDYWNFNYDSKWTIEVKNRTLFTKQLDYNYQIGDRGRTILNTDANIMYTANTDWINEYDYNYLQELITSNDVFVIDEINGYKLPINIEDTSYVQKTVLRDKLFNLTITYRNAYDINLGGS
jgi:hypothetical protein